MVLFRLMEIVLVIKSITAFQSPGQEGKRQTGCCESWRKPVSIQPALGTVTLWSGKYWPELLTFTQPQDTYSTCICKQDSNWTLESEKRYIKTISTGFLQCTILLRLKPTLNTGLQLLIYGELQVTKHYHENKGTFHSLNQHPTWLLKHNWTHILETLTGLPRLPKLRLCQIYKINYFMRHWRRDRLNRPTLDPIQSITSWVSCVFKWKCS